MAGPAGVAVARERPLPVDDPAQRKRPAIRSCRARRAPKGGNPGQWCRLSQAALSLLFGPTRRCYEIALIAAAGVRGSRRRMHGSARFCPLVCVRRTRSTPKWTVLDGEEVGVVDCE